MNSCYSKSKSPWVLLVCLFVCLFVGSATERVNSR